MTHTPGPWHAGHFADDSHPCNCASIVSEHYLVAEIVVGNGKPISDGGNDAPPLGEAKANARLIAAAPDLLDAVHVLMDQPTMNPLSMTPDQRRALWAAHDKARAALAKAEGREP